MLFSCDKCGGTFESELQTRKEGNLEITFIKCDRCNHEYVSLVTDKKLRENIKRANRMIMIAHERKEKVPETFIQKCRNLRRDNIQRGLELRARYQGIGETPTGASPTE